MSSADLRNDTGKENRYVVWMPFLLGIAIAIGLIAGASLGGSLPVLKWSGKELDKNGSIQRLEEVLQFIDYKYVDKVNVDDLAEETLGSFLERLDPYSEYLSPDEVITFQENSEGRYHGIGIEFHMINDTLTVIGLIDPKSPASEAGIVPGDHIIGINGTPVSGANLEIDSIMSILRGSAPNDQLTLEVLPLKSGVQNDITINRSDIHVNAVESAMIIADRVAYVRISRFSINAYRDFMEALEGTLGSSEKVNDLIIDLRGNPGGFLDEAVKITSQLFKDGGQLLVYTQGANSEKKEYQTTGKVFFNIGNVVILIDDASASGSEVMAAAIQEWDRGVIVGDTSYGKGLVQEQYELQNGGMLRLTTARYFTPSGRSIQKPFSIASDEKRGQSESDSNSAFLTKRLKRKLYPDQGVIPDILIPRLKNIDPIPPDSLKDWVIHPAVSLFRMNHAEWEPRLSLQEWISLVDQLAIPWRDILAPARYSIWQNWPAEYKDSLEKKIKAEWVRMFKGDIGKRMYLNTSDPYITTAVQLATATDPFQLVNGKGDQ